ncbi:MAG TPA: hypothetical protein VHG88_05365, partial [Burkholderiales bacterium]|nr:hypothetical protein [Burkholderiales bacterium]
MAAPQPEPLGVGVTVLRWARHCWRSAPVSWSHEAVDAVPPAEALSLPAGLPEVVLSAALPGVEVSEVAGLPPLAALAPPL